MKKPKQIHKSKAEILADLKANKDFMEKMSFARDTFYPALIGASKSIDDAMMFLGSITTVMMEVFLGMMKEKRFGEMNLQSKLDSKDEKYEQLCDMLKLFDDFTIFDARSQFEYMKSEIQMFVNDENKERSLSELKTKWVSDL